MANSSYVTKGQLGSTLTNLKGELDGKVNVNDSNYLNKIETIKLNDTALTISNKSVNIDTSLIDNLTNYYKKTETYSKSEIDNLVTAKVNIAVVNTLPTENISTTTIYLVPKSGGGASGNAKDEYINTTGTSLGWELIGSTEVDLSNYYTKSETDAAISAAVPSQATDQEIEDMWDDIFRE